jgi:mannose-1-phosphate guanylyltransferase / mannose-6-phosphate isomerase
LVCNQEYRFITAEQLLQVEVVTERIILEPFGKNTAHALTLTAQTICANGSDAVLLTMAADHAMQNIDAFHTAIANGLPAALDGHVVTFGVTPNKPATGYGYIQTNGREQYTNVLHISQFVEKPN